MFNKLSRFVLYNNLVPLAFGVLFLGAGVTFAASPEARDAVFSSETSVVSVDNSYIISVDLETYPFDVQITEVTEDEERYFVSYSLRTIDLETAVWQDLTKVGTIEIEKPFLAGRDLGVYVTGQLAEVRDSERARLLETQAIERRVGETEKITATVYSGLVGRMLASKEETLAGYVPVVVESTPTPSTSSGTSSSSSDTLPPAVTVVGENPARILLGSVYKDAGILVTGEDAGATRATLFLDGTEVSTFDELDTSKVWAYVLTYKVEDRAGNISEVRREVVVDGGAPTPSTVPPAVSTSTVETIVSLDVSSSSPEE